MELQSSCASAALSGADWADAAKEANRTLEGLRKLSRKVLEEAAAADGDCGCQGHGHGEAAGGRGRLRVL